MNAFNRILAAILVGLLLLSASPLSVRAQEGPITLGANRPTKPVDREDGSDPDEDIEDDFIEDDFVEDDFVEDDEDWDDESEEDPDDTDEENDQDEWDDEDWGDEEWDDEDWDDEFWDDEDWSDEEDPDDVLPEFNEDELESSREELDLKIYSSVPLYFQNDYPDVMFGSGTVETSGCSITSLAMVATYLTGHEYLPDELAGYFGGRAENNMARMEYGIEKMKLPCRKAENWHVVLKELERGKVVILLVDEKSIFTDSQHFVVLTGMTEDGLILVNDSNRDNYERWDLREKLITGFPQSDLCRGFNGAWCFDKSLMPENPFIYYEEEVYVEPRYVGVTLTMDERELLARMVWVESRGEPLEGQQAVAEVVLNRLYASNFQSSVESVIMAEGQFNSTKFLDDAEPNQTQYEAVERALKGPYVTPINTVYFGQQPSSNGTLWKRIGGHYFSTQWLPEYN